jgi:hypothetical protein
MVMEKALLLPAARIALQILIYFHCNLIPIGSSCECNCTCPYNAQNMLTENWALPSSFLPQRAQNNAR